MSQPIRVTVWNEGFHEQHTEITKKLYPEGMAGRSATTCSSRASPCGTPVSMTSRTTA